MHEPIRSRDNPLLKDLRKLARDPLAYRKLGRIWLEGEHLCQAAQARGIKAAMAVCAQSYWPQASAAWADGARRVVVVADELLAAASSLPSPAPMGYLLDLPPAPARVAGIPTVVLDRVQDAGNVGSILRSAAAFGFTQVFALKGTAALWSPKVLRAGMGAHFALRLIEGACEDDVASDALGLPLLATSSHQGRWLHDLQAAGALPSPCAWLFGHEGQGISPGLQARAADHVRITQPGGEESLNVAAAAAICLHASAAVSAMAAPA
ncbi:MAG: RNA methyltransferase [Burkholderiaceae bacterium]|jgi:TrmH family RNA methyltransferase|nr:RNA methyltransferase [Burkholderiaceae bacterium]